MKVNLRNLCDALAAKRAIGENYTRNVRGDAQHMKGFDETWQARYEDLGRNDVPLHLKAYFSTEKYFKLRELFLKHLMREFLKYPPPSGMKVPSCLDVGCNIGLYTKMLYDHKLDVQGVDYSETLLHEARENYPEIHFHKGNAYDLPFKSSSFDFVVSFGLIQTVENWQKVLHEKLRVLRPGGVGVVETNRIYPFAERLIRNSMWLMRRKMKFVDAIKGLRPYAEPASGSFEPKKYWIRDIVDFLAEHGVEDICIHDPARAIFFHNFFWAAIFVKPSNSTSPHTSRSVHHCPSCRKSTRWGGE